MTDDDINRGRKASSGGDGNLTALTACAALAAAKGETL